LSDLAIRSTTSSVYLHVDNVNIIKTYKIGFNILTKRKRYATMAITLEEVGLLEVFISGKGLSGTFLICQTNLKRSLSWQELKMVA
jgi:hypothetical protein